MHRIGVAVYSLDHLEKIVPARQDLRRRHARYGVRGEHYETVGGALLWKSCECLQTKFSSEVKKA